MDKMTMWERVLEFVEVMCDLGDYDWNSDFADEPKREGFRVITNKQINEEHPA